MLVNFFSQVREKERILRSLEPYIETMKYQQKNKLKCWQCVELYLELTLAETSLHVCLLASSHLFYYYLRHPVEFLLNFPVALFDLPYTQTLEL